MSECGNADVLSTKDLLVPFVEAADLCCSASVWGEGRNESWVWSWAIEGVCGADAALDHHCCTTEKVSEAVY